MTAATHIIWTTYGTWLPGDPRGHWSPLFDLYGHLLANGHQLNLPDKITHSHAQSLLSESPKILTQPEIDVTADVINKVLNSIPISTFTPKNSTPIATPYALAIEPAHIHLLIGPLSENLQATVGRLKGISSSLILDLPQNATRQRTWTASFWHVFLYDNTALHSANAYILNHNLRAHRPAHPHPFTKPL